MKNNERFTYIVELESLNTYLCVCKKKSLFYFKKLHSNIHIFPWYFISYFIVCLKLTDKDCIWIKNNYLITSYYSVPPTNTTLDCQSQPSLHVSPQSPFHLPLDKTSDVHPNSPLHMSVDWSTLSRDMWWVNKCPNSIYSFLN